MGFRPARLTRSPRVGRCRQDVEDEDLLGFFWVWVIGAWVQMRDEWTNMRVLPIFVFTSFSAKPWKQPILGDIK